MPSATRCPKPTVVPNAAPRRPGGPNRATIGVSVISQRDGRRLPSEVMEDSSRRHGFVTRLPAAPQLVHLGSVSAMRPARPPPPRDAPSNRQGAGPANATPPSVRRGRFAPARPAVRSGELRRAATLVRRWGCSTTRRGAEQLWSPGTSFLRGNQGEPLRTRRDNRVLSREGRGDRPAVGRRGSGLGDDLQSAGLNDRPDHPDHHAA
jgi:hypothetical protein